MSHRAYGPGIDSYYLYYTPNGHVLRCTCCNRYEILFHRTIIRLEPDEFARFARKIRTFPVDPWEEDTMSMLRFMRDDAPTVVRLVLTRNEVLELQELLAGASAMNELNEIISGMMDPSSDTSPHPDSN
ncbi:MAG: DUF6686 family protein [Bacteroidota bacterium]